MPLSNPSSKQVSHGDKSTALSVVCWFGLILGSSHGVHRVKRWDLPRKPELPRRVCPALLGVIRQECTYNNQNCRRTYLRRYCRACV
jgi:hypothetical protein